MTGEPTDQLALPAAGAHTLGELARLLRALRRRHARGRGGGELTYRQLAEKTGWSHTSIAEYFTARTLPPTDRFDALLVVLGARPDEQRALATARDRVEENRRESAPPGDRAGFASSTVPRQLPPAVASFAGRSAELAALDRLADRTPPAGTALLAVISGTAGVGKTTLAVWWAHRVAHRFGDGQLYLNLRGFDPSGPVLTPSDALGQLLGALGVPAPRVPAELDARTARFRSEIAGRRMLIVLDNARDAAQVRPLLPAAPGCLVVVTSRNRLSGIVAGHGGQPVPLDLLRADEAVALLAGRVGTDRVAAEPDAVGDIVTGCARLPLALAIVAARAAAYPQLRLARLAAELPTGPLDALAVTDDPHADPRAVFSWSYRALSAPAARLFRLFGSHPGPDLTEPAAVSLAGHGGVRPLLAELIGAGLLAEPLPGRYAGHDLLRGYAADLPEPERREATGRILDHYLHTTCRAVQIGSVDSDPITPDAARPGVVPESFAGPEPARAWLAAEQPVLRAAVDHAAATGHDAHAWQLAWAARMVFIRHGDRAGWAETGRVALAGARRLADPQAEALARRLLGSAYTELGRHDDAQAEYTRALRLHEIAGDLAGQGHNHHNLGILWERRGDAAQALSHAKQALGLYRAAGHAQGQATAANAVGWYSAQVGDYREALGYCRQALTLCQDAGDRDGESITWDSLGYAHHHLGEYDAAIDCYHQALSLFRKLGDRPNRAEGLAHLAETHLARGDRDAATRAWRQALELFTDLNFPRADDIRARLSTMDIG